MTYLVVPHGVSANSATVWLGGINESLDQVELTLVPHGNYQTLDSVRQQWEAQNGMYKLDYRRDTLGQLEPRKPYTAELRVNREYKASAQFTTLPAQLPTVDEKPFTAMLASCFCASQDESGRLGNTFFRLPRQEQPDVKIWCGDQVYLDSPWYHFSLYTHSAAELEVEHFQNYVSAWSQVGTAAGFQETLKRGANYFTSDDHEYWNNAPNWATAVRDTWSPQGRAQWRKVARDLFEAFQSDFRQGSAQYEFTVSPLSFFIADTRINRDAERRKFMLDSDLDRLDQWITNLEGPGIFSLGQPIFAAQAGFFGRFADWNLPDFEQYADLVRVLASSRHSLVLLTGDVHYGRIASCLLPSGLELIEIISSPTALVDKSVGGKWHGPPDFYPAFDIPGATKRRVATVKGYSLVKNHFLTTQFSASGARVKMTVKAWPVIAPCSAPQAIVVDERFLQ